MEPMERRTTNDESKDRRNTTLTANEAVALLTNQNKKLKESKRTRTDRHIALSSTKARA
jgi:hypothetical protein